MDLGLEGKVIVITGGGSISKNIAVKLIEEGATPCVLEDLADPKDCRDAILEIILKHRRIDAFVNNMVNRAGTRDYFTLANCSLPYLKKSKGLVVNICSENRGLPFAEDWSKDTNPRQLRINNVVVDDKTNSADKMKKAETIASWVIFLCSELSAGIRGQFIRLDEQKVKPANLRIDIDKIYNGNAK